jgi:hypothetical protein
LLARLRGNREGQRDHVVASRYSAKNPDDRVQPHRLLKQEGPIIRQGGLRTWYGVEVPLKRPGYMSCCQDPWQWAVRPPSAHEKPRFPTGCVLEIQDVSRSPKGTKIRCLRWYHALRGARHCVWGVREPKKKCNRIVLKGDNTRYLVNDLVIRHLFVGVFRCICTQKDAHHVLPVTFFHALPDKVARETLRIIQKRAEPTVLAQGEVADIMEQRIWDIAPQRPEY